jgi:hypothetical protein
MTYFPIDFPIILSINLSILCFNLPFLKAVVAFSLNPSLNVVFYVQVLSIDLHLIDDLIHSSLKVRQVISTDPKVNPKLICCTLLT